MITNYTLFVDRLINKYEGGYCWNRKDPGGPTKYGITCFDLAEHRGKKMNSMATWAPLVQELTLDEAETIYRLKYAGYVRFDDLPSGPDVCMLDYAVNSGNTRPVHVARAICRVPGGVFMDQLLLDAIKRYDTDRFVSQMCAERLKFMRGIRGGSAWAEFGRGWQSRVCDVEEYAHGLVTGRTAMIPAPDLTRVVTPKAKNVPKTAGTATAGSTLGVAVVAHEAGAPLWAVFGIAATVVAAGVAFEAWQVSRSNTLNSVVELPRGL